MVGQGRIVNIAIVGSGISGMASGYLLHKAHAVTVFEASPRIGGHTHTVSVQEKARALGVDTGFIVYNPKNYPLLVALFAKLGVETQETDMSFSVRCHRCRLEYAPRSWRTRFAQLSNLFDPGFYRLLLDARRFLRDAKAELGDDETLGDFVARMGYRRSFVDHLVLPLSAAIWSTSLPLVRAMPARFVLRFMDNHGMLDMDDPSVWRTVVGGSINYLKKLTAPFADRIRSGCGVARVARDAEGVEITTNQGERLRFDAVVLATHADEALALLADPSPEESKLLGAFAYSRNATVLHTDASVLPERPVLHCSWNYEMEDCRADEPAVSLTYYMNRLQKLDSQQHYCVTLNRHRPIREDAVLRRIEYTHPLFTPASVAAQEPLRRLSGARRTYYCGAYLGNGFHEDGLASAVRMAKQFGIDP